MGREEERRREERELLWAARVRGTAILQPGRIMADTDIMKPLIYRVVLFNCCEFQGINSDLAQDYCWIHGTSYIPPQYQPHMKCIVELEGVESVDDAPDTSYYQWVTFIMAIHAGIFYAPYYIWSILENGLVASFGSDGKTTVMITEEVHLSPQELVLIFCEFLNFFLMII